MLQFELAQWIRELPERPFMKRLVAVVLALVLGLVVPLAAGCGGTFPPGAIATVDGVSVTRVQFEQYITQAKASAGRDGEPAFPNPGTTHYRQASAEIINYLVEQQVVLNAAANQKITATNQQVQAQLQQSAAQYGGTQKMYAAGKQAGIMNANQLATYVKDSLLTQKLYQKVAGSPTPTEQQMKAYYKKNKAQFERKAAARKVRYIVVKTKAVALKARALLVATNTTATWKAVARKYSLDRGAGAGGGTLTAAARNVAASLKLGAVSAPIHSQYGWNVIEVTAITPAKRSTFASAKATIRGALTSQLQQEAWQVWLDKALQTAKIDYAAGYNPAQLAATPSASPSASP